MPRLVRSFATVDEVPDIRADLRRLMTGGGADHVDDAVLAASELLNNCILHTDNGCRVAAWLLSPHGVRVEVDDYRALGERMTGEARVTEGGRGLKIVDALATSWASGAGPTGRRCGSRFGASRPQLDVRAPRSQLSNTARCRSVVAAGDRPRCRAGSPFARERSSPHVRHGEVAPEVRSRTSSPAPADATGSA